MARRPLTDAPEVEVASRADLRDWLARHHTRTSGVWLVSYKRADPDRYLPYEAIVEECLSFGWVDSLSRAKDDLRSMLWIAPRKAGSNWSKPNKDRIARLDAAGLLAPPGRAAVARARPTARGPRSTGSRRSKSRPTSPPRSTRCTPARANWDAFPRSVRRGVLEFLLNAKRARDPGEAHDRNRQRLAADNIRPFQWRG